MAAWWLVGAGLLVLYTFVKFVIFKPSKLPQPEKENIRVRRNCLKI